MGKNNEKLVAAVLEYLRAEELDETFCVVDETQEQHLRSLGVPFMEDRLPIGQDYVYAGCLTFQMAPIGPVLVQL